jgi:hypothetical protein
MTRRRASASQQARRLERWTVSARSKGTGTRRMDSRSPGRGTCRGHTSSILTFLPRELRLAPPSAANGRLSALVETAEHDDQLAPQLLESSDLFVDGAEASFEQGSRVATRARASIADFEEVLDVAQPEAHSLGTLDESNALDGLGREEAVAVRRALGRAKEALPLVVAQRVGAHIGLRGRVRNGSCHHAPTVGLGVDSKVKRRDIDHTAASCRSWPRGHT